MQATIAQQATDHTAVQNEGGYGYNPHEAALAQEASDKTEARVQHIIANIATFKAAWGTAVAKYSKVGQIRALDLAKIEKEAGVTQNEIKMVMTRMAGK